MIENEPCIIDADNEFKFSVPASFAQKSMWLTHQKSPDEGTYNLPTCLKLTGALDIPLLKKSFDALIDRHEALRTRFTFEEGEVLQVIDEKQRVSFTEVELSSHEDAIKRLHALGQLPFDLANGPLFRVHLIRVIEDEYLLLINMHHIVGDLWSLGVLSNELVELYTAYHASKAPTLAPLEVQYADYSVWHNDMMETEQFMQQTRYWQSNLKDVPTSLNLPVDFAPKADPSSEGDIVDISLDSSMVQQLNDWNKSQQVSMFMLMAGLYGVCLSRFCAQNDICIGYPIASRQQPELENLVGMFLNTLVLRIRLSPSMTLEEVVQQSRDLVLDADQHQLVPYEQLIELSGQSFDSSRNPLFQAAMAHAVESNDVMSMPDVAVETLPSSLEGSKFEISFYVTEKIDGSIELGFEYMNKLFRRETIERFACHFESLIKQLLSNSKTILSDLDFISDDEQQIIERLNTTKAPRGKEVFTHRIFEKQALKNPMSVAVCDQDTTYTYGEINRKANKLAHYLKSQNLGPETKAVVLMDRSIDIVIAMLATMKVGASFVPLDPQAPTERIRMMIEQVSATHIICSPTLQEKVEGTSINTLCLTQSWLDSYQSSEDDFMVEIDPLNTVYSIFTSGSTGVPKAIDISHQSLHNVLMWYQTKFKVDDSARAMLAAKISFDVSIWELWSYLVIGARVYIYSEHTQSISALVENMRLGNISHSFQPPSVAELLLKQTLPSSLKYLFSAGDKLHWHQHENQHVQVFDLYGPTEATIFATSHEPSIRSTHDLQGTNIGAPIDNTEIYVLDSEGNQVPIGVSGEIHIAGLGLARGYCDQPSLTASVFVPNPFGDAGSRMYKSGDLAKITVNSEIEFLGRIDNQVSVRGYRVELGEIEKVLDSHPSVLQSTALGLEDSSGETQIMAHIVPSNEVAEVDAKALANSCFSLLREQLPDYMIPVEIVTHAHLPLDNNGKLDRKALAKMKPSINEAEFITPRTVIELELAKLWREVLSLEEVCVERSFFVLGGHSLRAMQLLSLIEQRFGISLSFQAFYEAVSIELQAQIVFEQLFTDSQLALEKITLEKIDNAVSEFKDSSGNFIRVAKRSEQKPRFPLTLGQKGLWFLDKVGLAGEAYNVPLSLRLKGHLEVSTLESSIEEIGKRHEIFRTRFMQQDGEVWQVVEPIGDATLHLTDMHDFISEGQGLEAALQEWIKLKMAYQFDLENEFAVRFELLRISAEEHMLVIVMHHIITDAGTTDLLEGELVTLYNDFSKGKPSSLKPVELHYGDYALHQRKTLDEQKLQQQLSYWKRHLGDVNQPLKLPADKCRPKIPSYKGGLVQFTLPQHVTHQLRTISQETDTSIFMLLLSSFNILLNRWSGQNEVRVGFPIAGRNSVETQAMMGFFVNTLAINTTFHNDLTVEQLILQIKEHVLQGYDNSDIPFSQVVTELSPKREINRNPIYQANFTYLHGDDAASEEFDELEISHVIATNRTSKFDISLFISDEDDCLSGGIEFSDDLFTHETVEYAVQVFQTILESISQCQAQYVSSIPLLTTSEARNEVETWNSHTSAECSGMTIGELFEQSAKAAPLKVALECDGEQMSYEKLNGNANIIAHKLLAMGVSSDQLVGIFANRSTHLIAAILGVLKSGGGYLPIDPEYPMDRVSYILDDAKSNILLVDSEQEALIEALDPNIQLINVETLLVSSGVSERSNPDVKINPQSMAYCIYTSGSTGKPKGCITTHNNMTRLFTSAKQELQIGNEDVWTLFHSYAFDFSVWEIFGALLHGGKLVIVPKLVARSPEQIIELIAKTGVTVLNLTPTVFKMFAREVLKLSEKTSIDTVKYIIFGGEALELGSLQGWFKEFTNEQPQLINMYGITETTVHVTYRPITIQDVQGPLQSPIGYQLRDLQKYILDPDLNPVPRGFAGELYIAGAGLARGYLNKCELTAERFIANPYSELGSRMYKTGDVVRYIDGHDMEYINRSDQQVKLRGYRIELEEIEACLQSHPQVELAVAKVVGSENSHERLLAWLVCKDTQQFDSELVRDYLEQHLPSFMVPSDMVLVDEIPVTAHGKLDRSKLQIPQIRTRQIRSSVIKPSNEMESQLVGIFEEVLGMEVSTDDNFFSLGGDSMLVVNIVYAARERNIELTIMDIFEYQTVGELAVELMSEDRKNRTQRELIPLPSVVVEGVDTESFSEFYPLTSMQQSMYENYVGNKKHGLGIYHAQQWFGVIEDAPNQQAMKAAIQILIDSHPVLRTRFFTDTKGNIVQGVKRDDQVSFQTHAVRHLSIEQLRVYIHELVVADRRRALPSEDGVEGPLRFHWLDTAERSFTLVMSINHMVDDGWGNQNFLRWLFDLYERVKQGENPQYTPAMNVFKEHVAIEHDMQFNEKAKHYWEGLSFPKTGVDTLEKKGEYATNHTHVIKSVLNDWTNRLEQCRSQTGVTIKALLLSQFIQLIESKVAKSDVTVGVVSNGRTAQLSDPMGALGMYWNLLPLSVSSSNKTFDEHALEVHQRLVSMEPYTNYSLKNILPGSEKDSLFASFNFVNFHNEIDDDEIAFEFGELGAWDKLAYPLNFHLSFSRAIGELMLIINYDNTYFTETQVNELCEAYFEKLNITLNEILVN
ncbi:hypothetical protein JL49_16495 [Pseudoalteromonas luteoviolacea]|nr:hypothetical protein JL49_16495 [Pseudoalteromonas luteoviolacea]